MIDIFIPVLQALCYHYPDQGIFLFLMGALSSQGSSSRDRKEEKISWKCSNYPEQGEFFPPSSLLAVVLQGMLKELSKRCLKMSFPRCPLNEKVKWEIKKKKKYRKYSFKYLLSFLESISLIFWPSHPLRAPCFGKSHASRDAASQAAINILHFQGSVSGFREVWLGCFSISL